MISAILTDIAEALNHDTPISLALIAAEASFKSSVRAARQGRFQAAVKSSQETRVFPTSGDIPPELAAVLGDE